jgi:hypothetical protein
VTLDVRETATVLAALREWQGILRGSEPEEGWMDEIASAGGTVTPLTADEIDELCLKLNAEDAREPAAGQAEGVTVKEPAEPSSSEMHCCVLTLRIPVTVFDDSDQRFTEADLPRLERYLRSVINEREELTDTLGRPAWGRLCFAGELFRHALDMMRSSLGPKTPMYFSRVPDATSKGEEFEISLERLTEP